MAMSRLDILAVDPGNNVSTWLLYAPTDNLVLGFGTEPNSQLLSRLASYHVERGNRLEVQLVIEMVESYGMPVGREIFETVLWIGRFMQAWEHFVGDRGPPCVLLPRRVVKQELCATPQAKDSNVRQALVDMFGPGREKAIGTKKHPGPLHGISKHRWQALALAVAWTHQQERQTRQ